jgi:hypothetical protein
VAAELVRQAKERGLSLTGPDGLLRQSTKTVIETVLSEEMTEHLGYEKHDPAGAGTGNIRNGTRSKTVLTEHSGPVEIEVPQALPPIRGQESPALERLVDGRDRLLPGTRLMRGLGTARSRRAGADAERAVAEFDQDGAEQGPRRVSVNRRRGGLRRRGVADRVRVRVPLSCGASRTVPDGCSRARRGGVGMRYGGADSGGWTWVLPSRVGVGHAASCGWLHCPSRARSMVVVGGSGVLAGSKASAARCEPM